LDQTSLFEEPDGYLLFVDKFKAKKTTDDCYTPAHIYNAVRDWAVAEYGLSGRDVVRPFYPGGDFERFPYPEGCVVIDNPPFSILSKIVSWYEAHRIDYFLFAPALTLLSSARDRTNAVISDSSITYENGAVVRTSFLTNLGEFRIHVSAELHAQIADSQARHKAETSVSLPKYVYPDNVLTAATIQKIARHGQTLRIRPEDCRFIRSLDSQKGSGKTLFGGGILLSDRAAAEKVAAEKAAAEKAAAIVWELSSRERMIVDALGNQKRGEL
jgi:hypothetical protein